MRFSISATCFVTLFLSLLYSNIVSAYEINVNLGGDAKGRFLSDYDSQFKLHGSIKSSWTDRKLISGAEQKNQIALGTHRWIDGNWSATISTSMQGTFECTLHFAETNTYFAGEGKEYLMPVLTDKSSTILMFTRQLGLINHILKPSRTS